VKQDAFPSTAAVQTSPSASVGSEYSAVTSSRNGF